MRHNVFRLLMFLQFLMDIQFSKLQLTKIITIAPYFLIMNNTKVVFSAIFLLLHLH